jgi:CheY-like chemotaxis protein
MNTGVEPGTGGAASQTTPMSARTILVVEDNDNDAALLKLMFQRSRILNPLQFVNSVQDAQCYLKGEGPFSDRQLFPFPILLLVDSHLRDGSGFDLLRWLQVHKAQTPLALVMLTGSDVHSFKMSYDLGAHSFLTKPLKFEDFQNMVQRVRAIKLTPTGDGHLIELE